MDEDTKNINHEKPFEIVYEPTSSQVLFVDILGFAAQIKKCIDILDKNLKRA